MWFVTFRSNQRLTQCSHNFFRFLLFTGGNNTSGYQWQPTSIPHRYAWSDRRREYRRWIQNIAADSHGCWWGRSLVSYLNICTKNAIREIHVFTSFLIPFVRAWPWGLLWSCFKLRLAHSQNWVTRRQTHMSKWDKHSITWRLLTRLYIMNYWFPNIS